MESPRKIQESGGRLEASAVQKSRYSVPRTKDVPPNRFFLGQTLAVILCPAKGGRVFGVTVDKDDLPRVLNVGFWRVANTYPKHSFRLYAYTFVRENGERKRVYLHRFVTSAPAGTEVDHRNHRGTDNRKTSNLTVCTHADNMKNQRRFRSQA